MIYASAADGTPVGSPTRVMIQRFLYENLQLSVFFRTFAAEIQIVQMREFIRRIFLNDHVILGVILLNTVVIYLQESGISHPAITGLDVACTLVFVAEMIIKQITYGV